MRRLFAFVMALLMVLSLTACANSSNLKSDIIGTWEGEAFVVGESTDDEIDISYLLFMEDGRCLHIFSADGAEKTGNEFEYTIDGSQLTLKYDDKELVFKCKVDGETLTLSSDGKKQVFTVSHR